MKTVIITGANSGLGFETAKRIAQHKEYRVVLACRSAERAVAAKRIIADETGNKNIAPMNLDTSSLASVARFSEQFTDLYTAADGLICNAGISPLHTGTSEDGFELVFATNYLGHFLLTLLLISNMPQNARIINVTSDMHNPPGGIEWQGVEHLAHPATEDRKKYSYSKLCNIYFTYRLAERLSAQSSGITVNAFNPGMMETNFARKRSPEQTEKNRQLYPDRVGDLAVSSDALAQLMLKEEFGGITGKYFDRSTVIAESSALSYNKQNANELWGKSLEFVKDYCHCPFGI